MQLDGQPHLNGWFFGRWISFLILLMTYPVSLIGLFKREGIFANTVPGRFLLNLWKSEATKEGILYRDILIVSCLNPLMTSWILYTYKAGRGGRLAQMIPDVRSLRIQKDVWFKPCHKAIHFCLTYHTSLHVLRVTCTNYMYIYIYSLSIYIVSHHVQYIYLLYIYIYISILHSPLYLTDDSDSPPVSRRYALVLSHWGMPSEGMLQCLWQQEMAEGLG